MLGCESNRITVELLSSVFWVRSYSIKIKSVRYFIPVPVSVWNKLPAGPRSLFFDKKKKNQCRFNPTSHEYSDCNLHLIRNAEVDILYFSLLTLWKESRPELIAKWLGEAWRRDEREKEGKRGNQRGDDIDEKQRREQRGKITPPCTRTSKMDFTSHRASFSAATMSIRMKMKISATQIGFALMKVISLGKKSRLIHEMRIDSHCSATHSFFFSLPSLCPACPSWWVRLYSPGRSNSRWHPERQKCCLANPPSSLIQCVASHAKLFGFKNSQECLWVSFI